MGGPDRQTTPRTGLDDFVAGLLKYGTLGYLPQSVLSQFYPPVPGAGSSGPLPPGLGGPGSEPLIPFQPSGSPMINSMAPGGGIDQLLASPQAAPDATAAPVQRKFYPPLPPPPPPSQPGGGGGPPTGSVPFDIGQFITGQLSLPQYGGQMTAGPNQLQLGAGQAAQGALQSPFLSPGYGVSTLAQLFNAAQPRGSQQLDPALMSLLGGGGFANQPGSDILQQLGLGGGPGSQYLATAAQGSAAQGSPLQQFLGNAAAPAQQSLMSLGSFNPALQGIGQLIQQLQSPGAAQTSPLSQFLGGAASPERAQLSQLGQTNPVAQLMQQLSQFGQANPAAQASQFLQQQAGASGNESQAGSALSSLLGGQTGAEQQAQGLLGGLAGGQNLSSLFSAIDAARQQGLSRDVGNIREQFSAGGAGLSTGLAREIANRQQQSERDYLSQIGQLGLSALPTQVSAAQALGGLGGQQGARQLGAAQALGGLGGQTAQRQVDIGQLLGQLGLGGASSQQSALSNAGQLGLGGLQGQLAALQAGGQLGLGGGQLGLGAAQGITQAQLADLSRQTDISQLIGQLGIGGYGQQAGVIGNAGQLALGGQQAGIGAAQGLTQANIADLARRGDIGGILQNLGLQSGTTLGQQGISQASLLSQILQGNQATSLSALQSLPGATQTFSQIPGQVAGQAANIGDMLRQIQQQGLTAQQAEYQRTAGALFPSILQYAAGAPQIYTPGIGQQLLGAGAGLGGAALGAK